VIRVYRDHKDAIVPTKAHRTDAGFDIYSIESITIASGGRMSVETGLRIVVPEDSYYTFVPRSSLAFKYNLIPSHHNVMDSGYRGNCAVLMHNRARSSYRIAKGDRFCQLIVHRVPYRQIREISEGEFCNFSSDRRDSGFGSSGR